MPVPAHLPIPGGFLNLAGLARLAWTWSEILRVPDAEHARSAGRAVSCRKGCMACCHQLIPVSAAEAFALMETISALDPDSARRRLLRMEAVREAVEGEGDSASPASPWFDTAAYFRLGQPCPFLDEGACSIHPRRPLACREQLVTSDPGHCSAFPNHAIQVLGLSHGVGEALSVLGSHLLGVPPVRIPLVNVPAWVEENGDEGLREWEAGNLAEALASQLFSR